MPIPATQAEIAAAIVDLLVDGEVWDEDDLVAELLERGVDLGADPEDAVAEVLESDDLPLVVGVADGYVSLSALLRGRTFTHRLTEGEMTHDVVVLGADLSPLWCLADSEVYHRAVDGTEVLQAMWGLDDALLIERGVPVDDVDDDLVWLLPRGALAGYGLGVGDVLAVTVRDDGFEIGSAVPLPDADVVGRCLTQQLGQRGEDEPDEIDAVVWQACVEDPDFLVGAHPPLIEVLEAAGIAREGEFVAPPGFDFMAWRSAKRVARIAALHRLDEDEALAVLALKRIYDDVARLLELAQDAADAGDDLDEGLADLHAAGVEADGSVVRVEERGSGGVGSLVRDLIGFADSPLVIGALLVETIGAGRDGAAALGLFAETLEAQVPRPHRASFRWLRAKALERMGSVLEAEEALDAALDLDPDHVLSLYDAARYASDRGNAERGLSLLRRADAPMDDDTAVLLTHFRPVERTDIGRNQPCWCGSGRKYKVCHRGRETLPLADRAAWLYQKAAAYVIDGPWRERVIDAAEIRAHHWNRDDAVWYALNEGLVSDLVLFEGGAFAEFVAERGVLLPEDERLLADQWLLVERSVHEIEAVTAGVGFTARDVRTGDRAEVREGTASRSLHVGDLICARLVPAGETVQLFGGFEMVTLSERDDLITALDDGVRPEELVALLSARFAPPHLQNTEGEPMVVCDAVLRSQDPVELAGLLDTAYERVDGEDGRWVEHVTTHGMERIRATLELTGADLSVETNSEARLDRVLARVRELQPGLTLMSEARRPAEDLQQAMRRSPSSRAHAPLDPQDPAVAEALNELVRVHEEAWLDEPIPALTGATPRQAAADPTRRPDLLRLLDSYDRPTRAGSVSMDPGRLRSVFGLD